uniref:Ig-like domain-containing protein n=1 Tax=Poecilia formosa TaxID=48698 RepID=A0A087XVK3_POEFO
MHFHFCYFTVTNASPSLFPLTPCDPGSGDTVTLGCLAQDFFPKSATFQWTSTSNSNTQVDSQQFIFSQQDVSKFTGVSVISVPRSKALSYNCSLTHPAGNKNVPVQYAFSPPSVTLLSESDGEKQVLVCSIENFAPKKVSISWKKNNNNVDNVKSFEPMKDGDVYSAASIFKVNKTEWDSKAVYTCDVTHAGQNYIKKASKASLTVTLNPPNPKAMFVNKRAELKCVVTGPDSSIVSKTKIQWYIDEQPVTNNISESNDAQTKTSTLIQHFDDWKKVKTVKCSATREGMAPITKSLNVNRGMPSKFNGISFESNKCTSTEYMFVIKMIILISVFQFEVCIFHINCKSLSGKGTSTVEVLTPSTIKGDSVTLVCLVTSTELQDYYIAWSEASGHDHGVYNDGLNLPPQKINNGYQVSSFYTISKDKWSKKIKFSCNVWPAGSDEKMKPHDVSSFSGNSCECD